MKRRSIFKIITAVAILLGLMETFGCDRSGVVDYRLDLAESLMEEKPDSALCVLDGIDGSELPGKRIKARYALLKSMALDKNRIDTATFDVLQPAIDYYRSKGNPDERIRTYYYEGRIHRNAGDDDLAMQSYLRGLDNLNQIKDSLTLARMLVAQATLYYKQYRIRDFVENNLRAAKIYERLDRQPQQLNSNLKALTGEIILSNKNSADSILVACKAIVKDFPSMKRKTLLPFLKNAVNFGTEEDVRNLIEEVHKADMEDDMNVTLARAYSKIGNPEKGLRYIDESKITPDNILDSLTFWSVKTEIMESMNKDKDALENYRNYTRLLEEYHQRLFSNELLFAEKKHEMEMESLVKIHRKDNVIKWILAGTAILLLLVVLIYYRYRMNRAARLIAEGNARKLRLETENLQLESERLRLETENLRLELSHLEDERERLEELLQRQDALSDEARQVVRERIDLLNGLLAKALTNEDGYGKEFEKYVKTIKKDKKRFQESIGKVLEATHPVFMAYLREHGLTEREIDYVCLYAIGLRGKEIGDYLELARHYNISSDIRKKLRLDSNGENLGPFIRRMMNGV